MSSGEGLFSWREAGFRTAIAVDIMTTVVAIVALALALAARPAQQW